MRARSSQNRLAAFVLAVLLAGCSRPPAPAAGDGLPVSGDLTVQVTLPGRDGGALPADGNGQPPDARPPIPDRRVDSPGPPLADLIIKQFDAKIVGVDIVYDVTVCNKGSVAAFLFRVDIYYNRPLPPGPLQVGDVNQWVLALGPGACQSFSRTYKSPAVGLYSSWAFADTLGTVKESDESNNAAGPKLLLVTAPADCIGLCVFATGCGLFQVAAFPQCLTWCNLLLPAEKQCAVNAQQAGSCPALKACKLPPPPPPPPPPWECLPLCNYVVDTCKLLPQSALLTCAGGCLTLPSTKLQCALDAMKKKQCLQIALCIF